MPLVTSLMMLSSYKSAKLAHPFPYHLEDHFCQITPLTYLPFCTEHDLPTSPKAYWLLLCTIFLSAANTTDSIYGTPTRLVTRHHYHQLRCSVALVFRNPREETKPSRRKSDLWRRCCSFAQGITQYVQQTRDKVDAHERETLEPSNKIYTPFFVSPFQPTRILILSPNLRTFASSASQSNWIRFIDTPVRVHLSFSRGNKMQTALTTTPFYGERIREPTYRTGKLRTLVCRFPLWSIHSRSSPSFVVVSSSVASPPRHRLLFFNCVDECATSFCCCPSAYFVELLSGGGGTIRVWLTVRIKKPLFFPRCARGNWPPFCFLSWRRWLTFVRRPSRRLGGR